MRDLKKFNETIESLCMAIKAETLQRKLQEQEYSKDRQAMINELGKDISDFKDLLNSLYNEKQ